MPEMPLVNGNRYSFASIELFLNGDLFVGAKEISYDQELKGADVYGTHAQKIGRTKGKLTPSASLTLYKEEWNELLALLGDGYMEVVFPIGVSYAENDFDSPTLDVIHGARIEKVEDGHSDGEDPLEVKLTLNVMWIEYNGKKPLKNMLGGSFFSLG